MIRSECLKLKNSSGLYLVFLFTLLEVLTIPIYLAFGRSIVSMTDLSLMTLLFFPLLAAILSILTFEQESLANHFQEIKANKKTSRIWLSKLVVVDLLLFFPSAMIWLITGISQGKGGEGLLIASASWLMAIFLNHFHLLLTFVLNRGGNIIVAIVEILLIVFASNKVLLGAYWCPIALPVNFVVTGGFNYLMAVVIWIVLCTLIIVSLPKNAIR
uniref:Immunity protein n=1 Tax=Lactococcus lactis TaxID=1358 RepID=B5MEU6_9LACT|nr:immunity protein [Lactococcus lactis]